MEPPNLRPPMSSQVVALVTTVATVSLLALAAMELARSARRSRLLSRRLRRPLSAHQHPKVAARSTMAAYSMVAAVLWNVVRCHSQSLTMR